MPSANPTTTDGRPDEIIITTTVLLTSGLKQQLRERAQQLGVSKSQVVREILARALNR